MNVIRSAKGLFSGLLLLMSGAALADKHEFSIVVLPDTQKYAESYPAIIEAQMQWIVDNRDVENIIYVAQLGDLKDDRKCNNKRIATATGGDRTEWAIVDQAFGVLETATSIAQPNGIPFGTVAGNHDFEPVGGNCPTDWDNPAQRILTTYNQLFGPSAPPNGRGLTGRAYFGGSRQGGSSEDTFTLFESNGIKFIAINLGYRELETLTDPAPEQQWASQKLQEYSDRIGIITSHYFMRCNNSTTAPTVTVGSQQLNGCDNYSTSQQNTPGPWGAQVYQNLRDNRNLFMMLGAHKLGEAYRLETRSEMQPVHVMLANYQNMSYPSGDPTQEATFRNLVYTSFGDSGFMRIMRFDIDSGTVDIETFSPPVPETPAVSGTVSVANCQNSSFVILSSDTCSTPAISARSELKSVFTPANPGAADTLHTGTASNMTDIDFTGYAADEASIVVLPSTSFYLERNPEIFEAQIDWVVNNQVSENIIYVSHLGDLKDDPFCDNKTVNVGTGAGRTEWQIVDDTLANLEVANVPYGVLPGNHDFDPVAGFCPNWTTQRPLSLYNSILGPARFAGQPHYGDSDAGIVGNRVAGSNEDNFTLFGFGGIDFIAINLAYRPAPNPLPAGNPELNWADNLLKTYPDRLGIVTSHYFLNTNDGLSAPMGAYGQAAYDALSNNPNLFMMLSGQWYGEAWLTETTGRAGLRPVQIMMSNYEGMQFPDDGDPGTPPNTPNPALIDFANLPAFRGGVGAADAGFMRIMRFDKSSCQVNIETFSPPVIPIKNRTGTLVSTYSVASGAGMGEFTASNYSFSFAGYVAGSVCP